MIPGEAPEMLIRGTIPGWLQVRPGCMYRNKITGAGRDRMAKVVVLYKKCRSIRQALFFGSHSARKENSRSEEIRHHYGRGRSSHRAERDSPCGHALF
jgi:hypothetical protein